MNSRERVLAALEHRETDRVPIDLGGTTCSTIAVRAHDELKEFLGLKGGRTRIRVIMQTVIKPDERILKRFNVDVRCIIPHYPSTWKPAIKVGKNGYYLKDEWGNELRMPKVKGYYFDRISFPLGKAHLEDLEKYEWPNPHDEGRWEGLKKVAKNLYENTGYALVASGGLMGIFELACSLRGMEKFLTDLIVDRRFAEKLMDKVLGYQLVYWDEFLGQVGDYVQVAHVSEDLGTQIGPIVSPDLFRKVIKPMDEKLWRSIKRKADVRLLLHSCGAIYQFIPDFIEMGVDALNPVQVAARNMDTRRLKAEFGERLTFWGGGCDTQRVLPYGSPREVKGEVKRRIKDLAPSGGFVFTQVHNIQAGTPPENIVAMFEAANEYGTYPISV